MHQRAFYFCTLDMINTKIYTIKNNIPRRQILIYFILEYINIPIFFGGIIHMANENKQLIIIGGVAAGMKAAAKARRESPTINITVITEEQKVEVVIVKCLECQQEAILSANDAVIRYGLNYFCHDKDCEDKYSYKL